MLVADHRAALALIIVITSPRLPFLLESLEVLLQGLIEMPHPARRQFLLAQVLVPPENGLGVPDSEQKVAGDVLYALTASGPESCCASSADDGSDEFEEDWLARESFPSIGLTIRVLYEVRICS